MIVVHADWGRDPRKRWIATARRHGAGWTIETVAPWALGGSPLECLGLDADEPGPVLIGVDFPIGLPAAYAAEAGITAFRDALLAFGGSGWERVYEVATTSAEISLTRPFYPQRPGGTRRVHLVEGLGIPLEGLWRECERATPARPAASPLFWTLGAKQVGKGAIAGWQELVAPLVREGAALWPFDGDLAELLATRRVTIAETYPAEYYAPLGFGKGWSKRRQADRRDRAGAIARAAAALGAVIAPEVAAAVDDGFGPAPAGEDAFDALVGLLGMLAALAEPPVTRDDAVEGWILGLPFPEPSGAGPPGADAGAPAALEDGDQPGGLPAAQASAPTGGSRGTDGTVHEAGTAILRTGGGRLRHPGPAGGRHAGPADDDEGD